MITGNTLKDVLSLFGSNKLSGAVGLTGAVLGAPELGLSEGLRGASSTGASATWTPEAPVPTALPPAGSPTSSTPKVSVPSGGGSQFRPEDENKTWFTNEFGQRQAIGGSGGTDSNILGQINDIYNNSINFLSTLEGNARGDYGQAVDTTGKAYELALQQSQAGYNQNLGQFDENRQELETEKRSALGEAVRAANALQQQRQARFGGGSSAGGAVSELIGAESVRSMGGIEQEFLGQARDLERGRQQLVLTQTNYENQLELQKQDALNTLKSELDNKLTQIQASRVETENAKAQMRISVIQDAQTKAENIKLAFQERAANIREAVYTKMSELDGNYNRLLEMAKSYEAGQFFDPYANQYSGNVDLSQQAQGSPAYRFNPYAKDEEQEAINPFYQPTGGASRSF